MRAIVRALQGVLFFFTHAGDAIREALRDKPPSRPVSVFLWPDELKDNFVPQAPFYLDPEYEEFRRPKGDRAPTAAITTAATTTAGAGAGAGDTKAKPKRKTTKKKKKKRPVAKIVVDWSTEWEPATDKMGQIDYTDWINEDDESDCELKKIMVDWNTEWEPPRDKMSGTNYKNQEWKPVSKTR